MLSCLFTACSEEGNYAPVFDITNTPSLAQTENRDDAAYSGWVWPARGKLEAYSSSLKGINIEGYPGEPVFAAASGKVVYCGNGLRGYGNLIIIKHNRLDLSAYAHNRTILVKEGDTVLQGQKIAEMGNTRGGKTILHFEIRHAGKPVDPVSLFHSV